MEIGIYPANIQQAYGARVGRRVVYAFTWKNGIPYTDTILLNIDNSPFHTYTKNTKLFAERVVKIYDTLKPRIVVIENEELLTGDIKTYCNELTAAVNALPEKCTNGGLTLPGLSYLYWTETHDSDFFTHNIFKKQELLAGQFNSVIDNVGYELDVLKSLPLYAINVHYYVGQPEQADGLIRMIKWIESPVISNECGIYTAGLLPEVIRVARETEMEYVILYSGNGSHSALPISKDQFQQATQ